MIYEDIAFNPPKEPARWIMLAIDSLSWGLPVAAAAASIASGWTALLGRNEVAALLGIAGGSLGALGVIFTNWAARVRDGRLAWAQMSANLGVGLGQGALNRAAPIF